MANILGAAFVTQDSSLFAYILFKRLEGDRPKGFMEFDVLLFPVEIRTL